MDLAFEPLRKSHDRATFTCGDPALDDWFRKRALQDDKRNVARVFVAIDRSRDDAIAGCYSLSAFTIALDALPDDDAIPAALIGRLARAESHRGQGVGELLLADTIKRILAVDEKLAVYAVVVDANHGARRFYESFGFAPFPATPRRLYLLTSVARAALAR